ncbi:MAG: TonB-dependent receptor [Pseudomonadota bacterium]
MATAEDDRAVLEPLTVWGDRTANAPGSLSVIGDGAITSSAADHPAEILNTLPGVNIQMNSGQEHLIALRSPVLTGGAGQGSFLILENGVPTRAAAFGNVNSLFELHHETASAIEVVRGPGSAKYGSNAVHGLINVIHGGPGAFDGVELRASASTLSRYRTDVIADNGENLRGAVSIQKDLGWRDFSGVDQQKASLFGDFSLGGWDASAWIVGSNLNQETADFIDGPKAYRDRDIAESNPDPLAGRDAYSIRAAVRLNREFGFGRVTLTPYAITQEMSFRQHFLPYKSFEENGHDAIGLMSRAEVDASDTVTIRYGADAAFASGTLKETQDEPFGFFPGDSRFPTGTHYDYDVDTTTFALWGEAEWAVAEDVTVLAGMRGETHNYDYTTNTPMGTFGRFRVAPDRTDNFDLFTPKLGVIWTPSDSDLAYYANYARGERAPQASDLYRLQSQQEPGEADTETLDSIEIGVRGTAFAERLSFDLAAYVMQKENFFFRDSDGLNVSDGETEHAGVEAAFELVLIDNRLSVRGTAAYADQTYAFDRITGSASETIRDGDRIDTAPEWLADLALVWMPTDAFEASFEAEHVGEYFTNPANTQDYPGHTVFHARGEWAVRDDLEVYLIVRNLFDLRYADRADFAFGDERYFPGEPLNATVGVRTLF